MLLRQLLELNYMQPVPPSLLTVAELLKLQRKLLLSLIASLVIVFRGA